MRDDIPEKLDSGRMVWRSGLWAPGGLDTDTGQLNFGCHECLDSRRLVSWTLDVYTFELKMSGSLDSGCLDVWTLNAWTLGLRMLWRLDSGHLDSGQFDPWTLHRCFQNNLTEKKFTLIQLIEIWKVIK